MESGQGPAQRLYRDWREISSVEEGAMGDAEPVPIRRARADQARLVADVLRHHIHDGGYPEGLPTEADLSAEFGVSRNAVREALATLKDEGLIDRGPKV